ncbi:MAG: hypothetical protein RMZ41_012945 [Nostoc sp. DedVER02]|uniref:hypothetical protein n=1 Tax=unclassified Nostoc TaxID=2593658 RepID=UPI002AD1E2BF|nr:MULTISPECIES: hypothetical protein [unclassified Nostoc]MDZ7988705.1 hypothetical protein [Nostoc sp. DedVER02]MDZ8113225.1 hypothetical protein [Nostoc sp. DedVER01b]
MSKLRELVERFLKRPPEVRFQEVYYLLEAFGFEEKSLRVAIIASETLKVKRLLYPR